MYVGDMDKKPRKKKRDYDFSITAFQVVQEATKEHEAVVPGRKRARLPQRARILVPWLKDDLVIKKAARLGPTN